MQFVWEGVIENGAKLIVCEPRRTRAAKMGEESGGTYVQFRSGTDIAFINGVIKRIIDKQEAGDIDDDHLTLEVPRLFWRDDGAGTVSIDWPQYSDATFKLNATRTDYERENKNEGEPEQVSGMPVVTTLDDPDSVYQYVKSRVENYDSPTVEAICGCDAADFEAAADMFIENSYAATSADSFEDADYQAGTVMYAMGTTQHSKGSHMTRVYCLMQMLLGNMGKPGGGVNALRGIGNVQGSTDMGLLFGNTIGYNFSQPWDPDPGEDMEDAHDRYFDGLFGDPYPEIGGVPPRFQQRGFHNLLHAWFSDGSDTETEKAHDLYAFYPKDNGINHRQFFQQTDPSMPGYDEDLPDVKAMVAWGMNPGNVEANQLLVREGLKNLDTLVVTEIFLTETAEAERKPDGVTYFLPAASFAETTGTINNSGRWIQRRWAARDAVGNTKSDLEILLRLAKALHDNGGIASGTAGTDQWPEANFDAAVSGADNGFTGIWGRYFLGVGAEDKLHPGDSTDAWDGDGTYTMPAGTFSKALITVIADNVYREFGAPLGGVADPRGADVNDKWWYSTLWIFSNASGGPKVGGALTKGEVIASYEPEGTPAGYAHGITIDRLARGTHQEGFISTDEEGKVAEWDGMLCKSYNPWDSDVDFGPADPPRPGGGLQTYPYWCIAWLFNRRVMYNMGYTTDAGDTSDLFVTPDQVSRFFVHHTDDTIGATGAGRTGPYANYSRFYRRYSAFGDPDFRTPRHVEAWETPIKDAIQADWSGNLGHSVAPVGIAPVGIPGQPGVYAGTDALRDQYPLVFTTFRYVMHYQGGAMTRNLGYINAIRPRPYLEIHTDDAIARGIENGDEVYVQTMRGKNIGPWVALVDGTIKSGVCGGPWHWGDRGLSTGPSANYACIDALDLSTTMNETKACLCEITKGTV